MVGIGPGSKLDRTRRAENAIAQSSVIVGYSRYLSLISDLIENKQLIKSGMRDEVERCRQALTLASNGATVSLVSSGDPGIYGMAGLVMELAEKLDIRPPIEVVPGITAASSTAARLGAPLMIDWATISLSDLLVDWNTIRKRLEAVARADLVVALYNPRSQKRRTQLDEAASIFREFRDGKTPVGIGTAVGTDEETIVFSTLDHFLEKEIGMRSIVIIGNGASRYSLGWFVTQRGYRL